MTPVLRSPGSTTRASAGSNSAGPAASIISTRQCLVPYVAQLRYRRHLPSGVTTSVGRSSDSVFISSLVIVRILSNRSPSAERAISTAYPRPSPSGRRSR